jgi:uncharacterized protein YbjQ (UPF0145 family)
MGDSREPRTTPSSPAVMGRAGQSRLPPAARERLRAGIDSDLWASSLPVGDEAALRAVGFHPVGVVTASVPSFPFPYRFSQALTRRDALTGLPSTAYSYGPLQARIPIDDAVSAKRMGGFSHNYMTDSAAGLIPCDGWSWQRVVQEEQQRQLFEAALEHLRAEASALAADGIVGVSIRRIKREAMSSGDMPMWEVWGAGVAVRCAASPGLARPFSTTASGAQVAQLLRGGFAPCEAIFGIGIVEADIGTAAGRRLRSLGSGEVTQLSEALDRSLSIAATDLHRRAISSGDLAVGATTEIRFDHERGASVWDASVRMTATAVRRFSGSGEVNRLSIMRLGPR